MITLFAFLLAITRRRVECVADNSTVLAETACSYTSRPEKTRWEKQRCQPAWVVGPWSKVKCFPFFVK